MSKITAATAVLLLFAAPAFAKDKPDPRVEAMLACGAVTAGDARLACYDQAMSRLKQAMGDGRLVLDEKTSPKGLEGIVTASGRSSTMRFWAQLDSGDRWQVVSTSLDEGAPAVGARVKLRKGVFGNYWFTEPGVPDRRALYLGRR